MTSSLLHTYSMARPFAGLSIPLAVQSVFLRDYACKRQMLFVLPKVEWCTNDTFYELSKLLNDTAIKNIAMVSGFMLPNPRSVGTSVIVERRDLHLHFALENTVINAFDALSYLEEIHSFRTLAAYSAGVKS